MYTIFKILLDIYFYKINVTKNSLRNEYFKGDDLNVCLVLHESSNLTLGSVTVVLILQS